MANRKPYLLVNDEYGDKKCIEFPTYRELLKNLKSVIKEQKRIEGRFYEGYVSVFRQRRGEWGEWFERWKLEDEKLVKIKEGWM